MLDKHALDVGVIQTIVNQQHTRARHTKNRPNSETFQVTHDSFVIRDAHGIAWKQTKKTAQATQYEYLAPNRGVT